MRGSQERIEWAFAGIGIIPAHAGLTALEASCHRADWDHPRACGAHLRQLSVRLL